MENADRVCWLDVLDFRSLREKRRGKGSICVAEIVPYARMLEKKLIMIIVMMATIKL